MLSYKNNSNNSSSLASMLTYNGYQSEILVIQQCLHCTQIYAECIEKKKPAINELTKKRINQIGLFNHKQLNN